MIIRKRLIAIVLVLSISTSSYALFDGGAGWANAAYLAKILTENIRRYQQLRMMIGQAKNAHNYLKLVNKGIDNALGLMQVIPLKDEKIIADFREFQTALRKIDQLYGAIPKSKDEAMQRLHDKTIAESFKIASSLSTYADKQETNAIKIYSQSSSASPKGAARINAQASAQILHSLNQLIKINGQILKLQGENFALANMNSKNSSESFNKSNSDLKKIIKKFKTTSNLPRF